MFTDLYGREPGELLLLASMSNSLGDGAALIRTPCGGRRNFRLHDRCMLREKVEAQHVCYDLAVLRTLGEQPTRELAGKKVMR